MSLSVLLLNSATVFVFTFGCDLIFVFSFGFRLLSLSLVLSLSLFALSPHTSTKLAVNLLRRRRRACARVCVCVSHRWALLEFDALNSPSLTSLATSLCVCEITLVIRWHRTCACWRETEPAASFFLPRPFSLSLAVLFAILSAL